MARINVSDIEREAGTYLLVYATRVINDLVPAKRMIASQYYQAIDALCAYRHARQLEKNAVGHLRGEHRREAVGHYATYRRCLRAARQELARIEGRRKGAA